MRLAFSTCQAKIFRKEIFAGINFCDLAFDRENRENLCLAKTSRYTVSTSFYVLYIKYTYTHIYAFSSPFTLFSHIDGVMVCGCVGVWVWLYVRIFISIHPSTSSLLTHSPLSFLRIQTSLLTPTLYAWRTETTLLVELRSTTTAYGAPSVTTTGLRQKLVLSARSWVSLGRWLLSAMERKRLISWNIPTAVNFMERGGRIFKRWYFSWKYAHTLYASLIPRPYVVCTILGMRLHVHMQCLCNASLVGHLFMQYQQTTPAFICLPLLFHLTTSAVHTIHLDFGYQKPVEAKIQRLFATNHTV